MGRKRSKEQIICNILQVCGGGGANKTQIVYSCNMNFHTVVPYLDLLINNDLVERSEGKLIRYRTTAKGEAALRCFRELEAMIPEMVMEEA